MSLSAYLMREVGLIAEGPTLREMMERVARLPPVNPGVIELV